VEGSWVVADIKEIMSKLKVERIGGFAGFGGTSSSLRSIGEIDTEQLSIEDRKIVEELFASKSKDSITSRDTFRFRISRISSTGTETVETGEERVPGAVKACVKDEIV
jgi:hypothetical protein